MTIRIQCPKKFLESFKTYAISAFPNERYGVFFGRWKGHFVRIKDIWIPEEQKASKNFTEDILIYKPWRDTAEAIAESEGLEIAGDIHSHPYPVKPKDLFEFDPVPSTTDWKHIPKKFVHAICEVNKAGGKTAATVKFWPWLPKVEVELT